MYSLPNVMRVTKKNAMGGACGTYGGQERFIQVFGRKT
jgi:hypothetical protein